MCLSLFKNTHYCNLNMFDFIISFSNDPVNDEFAWLNLIQPITYIMSSNLKYSKGANDLVFVIINQKEGFSCKNTNEIPLWIAFLHKCLPLNIYYITVQWRNGFRKN